MSHHPTLVPRALVLVTLLCTAGAATPALAHVSLDLPDGGESLPVGSVYTITWRLTIPHDQLDWDLWYSVTGIDGPWIEIAMDLPVGDTTAGSVHTYEWTVPDTPSDTVRVRVRQDNTGFDYEDYSAGDLAIVTGEPPIFTDGFEAGDTSGWSTTTP